MELMDATGRGDIELKPLLVRDPPSLRRPWQFSLRTMMLVVTVTAIISACAGWFGGQRVAAATCGIGYTGALTWVVAERASRSLQRRLRKSPLERIYLAICWAGIACGVLVGAIGITVLVWNLLPASSWAGIATVALLSSVAVFPVTLVVAAYFGLSALMMALLLSGVLVLVSTADLRRRVEKQFACICGGAVGSLALIALPLNAMDRPGSTAASIAVPILGVAIPPFFIWLADRRFPSQQFRLVSRETNLPTCP